MIRLVGVLLGVLLASPSFAQIADAPITNKQYWAVTGGGGTYHIRSATSAGGAAACLRYLPATDGGRELRINPTMSPSTGSPAAGPYTSHLCNYQAKTTSNTWIYIGAYSAARVTCPASTPYWDNMLGKCVVNEPPPPDTNLCLDRNPFVRKWSYGAAVPPYHMPNCVSGCVIAVDEVLVCRKEPGSSSTYCMMEVHRTGPVCPSTETPSAPSSGDGTGTEDKSNPKTEMPPTSDPGGKCPVGSVQGGVDSSGTPICIGTGTNPPDTPQPKPSTETSQTEAMPDGGTKTTTTKTTTNADGSTTTHTTVVIKGPDGSTQTSGSTTTGTKPDGTQGTNDRPTEDDKYDLCKQNPTLSVCRNSSVSGTCGAVTCQGDAIQCATLRAAAAMECKQRQDAETLAASPLFTLGSAAAAGNDPTTLPGPANSTPVAMPASLDGSGWLGGGAPFPDKSFTVQGHTITIPFSEAVSYLVVLRYALMIVALLVSFRILSGAIIRE